MVYRLALVTGATSGIGEATSQLIASKGISLLLTGRNRDKLVELQNRLKDKVSVDIIQADLAVPQERAQLIEQIHHQAPDLIINNAGFGYYGDVLTYTTEEQAKILEVNGTALLEITMEAARTLISKQQKGTILNVSSTASFIVMPVMAVYAASKAFVTQFSQAVDFEFQPYGVRVLTLCPGPVDTAFQKRASGNKEIITFFNGITADEAAALLWKQIEKVQILKIIDWKSRIINWVSQLLPKKWIAAMIQKDMQKRIAPREIIKIKT